MRYSVYDKLFEKNGIEIFDILSVDWSKFDFPNGFVPHTVTKPETERVDVITYQYYQTMVYEDIVFLINKIPNLLDLPIGLQLKIPKLIDIREFLLTRKGR